MFSLLGNRLIGIFSRIKRKGIVSEADLKEALREIRITLLEADVALEVAKDFISNVGKKAINKEFLDSITPGQAVMKTVHDELIEVLESENNEINLKAAPPAVIMLVGLHGVGKTTTAAKLAAYLKKRNKGKVLLASLDTYRPAAQEQLETLGKKISVETLPIVEGQIPVEIVKRAMNEGKSKLFDIIILDTAGRLHTDQELVDEIIKIKNIANPIETLLTLDSMAGQDAVKSAKQFHDAINLSGIILTKVDADSRGGATLSVKHVIGRPIKFMGHGEKISDFERFHAERIASRILGMGDVTSLVERASDIVNGREMERIASRMEKGVLDMVDFREQLKGIKKMGSVSSLIAMLPGTKSIREKLSVSALDSNIIVRQEAIIDSMTKKEKMFPKLMNASRKVRVAKGSGTSVEDVNRFLNHFFRIQTMMKKIKKFDKKGLKKFENIIMSGSK